MKNNKEKDVYDLINSKTIGNYCRKIQHKFNTEEIAVLIFRNRTMSINEKIKAYKNLIENYPDMEVIERINCKHYDSVKEMIQREIDRLKTLNEILQKQDDKYIYTYIEFNKTTKKYDFNNVLNNIRKTFNEVEKNIKEYIEEYNDTLSYKIIKKSLKQENYKIIAEYVVINKKGILINIYDTKEMYLDIDNIFINIPTPFKKGDILVSWHNTPFREGVLPNKQEIFVLNYLCTWNEKINESLKKGNYDSSDMIGSGYFLNDSQQLILEEQWCYDSFEYYNDELKGMQKILKAVSNLLKEKIEIEEFINIYEHLKNKYWNYN